MNIFVSNLDRTVTPRDLRRAFAGYGTIIDVRVPTDTQTGKPLGHGHVYLVPERAAREALEELNLAPLRGRPIKIRECVYRKARDRRVRQAAPVKVERRRATDRRRYTGVNPLAPQSSAQ
jgi:RNA recognition motif-containing protein